MNDEAKRALDQQWLRFRVVADGLKHDLLPALRDADEVIAIASPDFINLARHEIDQVEAIWTLLGEAVDEHRTRVRR